MWPYCSWTGKVAYSAVNQQIVFIHIGGRLSKKLKTCIFAHPKKNNTMPTLSFNSPSEITFSGSATELRILVNGTLLGAINANTPVTLFISQQGSQKAITLQAISNNDYTNGNTNSANDTVHFNHLNLNANMQVQVCSTNSSLYKLTAIGVEDDITGQGCQGNPNGFTHLFNISASGVFKAKIESYTYGGQTINGVVVRYSANVMNNVAPSAAVCHVSPYCFYPN